MLRTTLLRTSSPLTRLPSTTITSTSTPSKSLLILPIIAQCKQQQQRRNEATLAAAPTGTQHAISNPTLANIEKRWEGMPPAEQAELWMALRKRMKIADWAEMTLQEKKAAYYIAFGPHGPRALPEPGENWKVLGYSAVGLAVSFVLFVVIRMFARPAPKTMTKEWQEMTNDYLKAQKSEPITGISSEGYKGKGYVQSPPENKA